MPCFKVECPNYRIACDIDTCPRYLTNIRVDVGPNGELVGQGFCNERGTRYFSKVPQEKISRDETSATIEQEQSARSQFKKDCALVAEVFSHCCNRCEDILVSIVGNKPSGTIFVPRERLFDRSALLNESTICDALSCFKSAVLRCFVNDPQTANNSTFNGHNSLYYLKGLQILWQTSFSALKRTLSAPKCLITSEQALTNALSKIEYLCRHGAHRYSLEDISQSFQTFLNSLPDLATAIAQHDYKDPIGEIGSRTLHSNIEANKITANAYNSPIANEIINDPGCELFNDTEGMRLTGESILSLCEKLSHKPLSEKEFSKVSHSPSLYPYWVMAEGSREIKEIWKLTPFYLGKTESLPKGTKLLSKYLDWSCNYSFWQAIEKFYRSAIQKGAKYNDSDIMMIHYLGIVYGKSIKLINSLHGRWLEFGLNKLGNHLYALLQSESNDKKFLHDLVLQELEIIKKWVNILHDELPEFELARLRGEMPTQNPKGSEGITMFPFEKKFKLIGQPNFIVPEDKQVALGRQLEKIAKAQEFKFKETTFSAPKYTDGDCDFEYRIQDKIDPDSDHYTIYFNYFKSDNTLRIYSCIPAARTMPIAKFIVENYLKVHLGKEISTSYGLDSTPVVFETPQPNIKFQERLYCERFKVSKDFKYIYDSVHTVDNYSLIQNLENTGNKVIEVLKKLFNAYGKKTISGWVYSGGGAWGPHFAKKPYSLFKSQQIAVRRNPNTNKSEWRIIPLAEFDEESPIGLHSKRKNHSNQKNNF